NQADGEGHLRGVLAARRALDPVPLLRERHRIALGQRSPQVLVVHPGVATAQIVAFDGPQIQTLASDHTQLLGAQTYPIRAAPGAGSSGPGDAEPAGATCVTPLEACFSRAPRPKPGARGPRSGEGGMSKLFKTLLLLAVLVAIAAGLYAFARNGK